MPNTKECNVPRANCLEGNYPTVGPRMLDRREIIYIIYRERKILTAQGRIYERGSLCSTNTKVPWADPFRTGSMLRILKD
jgi:hypothetical protein